MNRFIAFNAKVWSVSRAPSINLAIMKAGTMEHDQREAVHLLSIELIWFAKAHNLCNFIDWTRPWCARAMEKPSVSYHTSQHSDTRTAFFPCIDCIFCLDRRAISVLFECDQKPFGWKCDKSAGRRHGSCQNHVFHQLASRWSIPIHSQMHRFVASFVPVSCCCRFAAFKMKIEYNYYFIKCN